MATLPAVRPHNLSCAGKEARQCCDKTGKLGFLSDSERNPFGIRSGRPPSTKFAQAGCAHFSHHFSNQSIPVRIGNILWIHFIAFLLILVLTTWQMESNLNQGQFYDSVYLWFHLRLFLVSLMTVMMWSSCIPRSIKFGITESMKIILESQQL